MDNYIDEEAEFLFGSRTIFVPGRTVEIGYSVRKKSAFPLVEEFVLKLLNAAGGSSLAEISGFLDLPAKDLTSVMQPLLSKGLVTQYGEEFQLSDVGKTLFTLSDDNTPALTESESRVHKFTIDDECALPINASDFSEHRSTARGGLKFLIEDLRQIPSNGVDTLSRVRRNFGEFFAHFIRNEGDLEKIKEEQLELHRTEYVNTKKSFAVQVDIQGSMRRNGVVVNRVLPLDDLTAKPDSRMKMRAALIESAKSPASGNAANEINFIRELLDSDFLEGLAADQPIPWFKVMPMFLEKNAKNHTNQKMILGELCVPRNLLLIQNLFSDLILKNEFSPDSPLRISWLRPAIQSWGRSIAFLEGIKALRFFGTKLRKGSVVLELWENRMHSQSETEPQLRHYRPWFDQLKYFRSPSIPSNMEILLVGDGETGIAVTHAIMPNNACFSCAIGVSFEASASMRELIEKEVEPKLRSLPKTASKDKS
jgi:hypothetical protein